MDHPCEKWLKLSSAWWCALLQWDCTCIKSFLVSGVRKWGGHCRSPKVFCNIKQAGTMCWIPNIFGQLMVVFKCVQCPLGWNVARKNLKSIYITRDFGINLRILQVGREETGEVKIFLFSSSCTESQKKCNIMNICAFIPMSLPLIHFWCFSFFKQWCLILSYWQFPC